MNVTQDYIDWLNSEESFSAKAYKDGYVNGVQMYSIGFGHQIQPNEQYLRTATIDKAKGAQLRNQNIKDCENFVNSKLKKTLNQNQFNACVDCCYNAGVGAWQNEVLPLINGGYSVQAIAAKIKGWRTTTTIDGVRQTSKALIARRLEVSNWYMGASPSTLLSKIKTFTLILLVGLAAYTYIWNDGKLPRSVKKVYDEVLG